MANSFTYQDQTIHVGDTVRVHQKIQEDEKTRIQVFEGLIIAVSGGGENCTFTVRKIGANSIGVERIIPVMSPFIDKIETKSLGAVRRAKLYYMRDRIGRQATRVKEKKAKVVAAPAKVAKPTKKAAKASK